MYLKMEIDCDNAAFEGNPAYESQRIMARIGLDGLERVFSGRFKEMDLMDSNGNYVGRIYLDSGEAGEDD